jgi:putative NIF3 family GTP cyclohydrolase 1 type 2
VIGYLPESDDSLQFLQRVKEAFGVECLMHNELLQRPIQSVAICGGAGDFMLDEAIRLQADAFLTGEMHYHQFFGHDQQIQIAVLGHYQSERYTPDLLFSVLGRSFPSLPLFRSTVNTNPIKYL